eukprot:1832813-Pyramimonas_sp.AAC.1
MDAGVQWRGVALRPHPAVPGAGGDWTHYSAKLDNTQFKSVRSGETYDCSSHVVVPTALRAGFLTPCQDQLSTAVMLELFACADGDFMDKFSMAGAVQSLQVSVDVW